MFEKLFKYIGKSIKALIDRTDEPYCLRLHKNRVFYVRESLMRRATNVRDALGITSLVTSSAAVCHDALFLPTVDLGGRLQPQRPVALVPKALRLP